MIGSPSGRASARSPAPRWTYPARLADAQLVYCSFGSKGASYPAARRVIHQLIETARARPGLDVVLAVPDDVTAQLALPPTVHTLRWAPQREILREGSPSAPIAARRRDSSFEVTFCAQRHQPGRRVA